MARIPNTVGGGACSNEHGLLFEQTTDLRNIFSSHPIYEVCGNDVYIRGTNEVVATLFQKHALYKNLLELKGIDYKKYISKKLLPDDSILIYKTNTLYVIEKKFQHGLGSVDEKLQTCAFKKRQYAKLLSPLNINIEYCYLLSDWFRMEKYNDVKEYIIDVGCYYFFGSIPLSFFNL